MPTTTGQQIGFVIGIILALAVVVFGVMYGVTGKIPFIPESRSRRKTFRRKSYRRENNDGGIATEFGYGGIGGGELGGYIDQERAEGSELSGYGGLTQLRPPNPFADPGKSGRVAAKLLKSGCSECYRTIREFAQGVGEEMYPSDYVSYIDM